MSGRCPDSTAATAAASSSEKYPSRVSATERPGLASPDAMACPREHIALRPRMKMR